MRFISPITWPGGKSKQWNLIKSYFPKENKDLIYVEPFFGGGSVGLNALREQLFSKYIFSDLNEELMNFWKDMMPKYEIIPTMNYLYWPNTNMEKLKEFYKINQPLPYFRHMKFLMNNNLTFNGQAWGTWTQQRLEQNWNVKKGQRVWNCKKLLWDNKHKINFLNKHFVSTRYKIPKAQTNPSEIFYYLDPPYYQNEGKPYKHRILKPQFSLLVAWLKDLNNLKIKFLLSIDDCEETREMFKEYNIHIAEWKYTSTNAKKHPVKMGKELIITNY